MPDLEDLTATETESEFARAIREHLDLKARNAGLDRDMPLDDDAGSKTPACDRGERREHAGCGLSRDDDAGGIGEVERPVRKGAPDEADGIGRGDRRADDRERVFTT